MISFYFTGLMVYGMAIATVTKSSFGKRLLNSILYAAVPMLIACLLALSIFLIAKIYPHAAKFFTGIIAAIKAKSVGIKGTDYEEIEGAIETAGYEYDLEQDIFYSSMNPWQKKMGYCRLYDEAAAPMGMIIDCEPIYFKYEGKKWLIEFWKGQYDLTTGCEVGVYTTKGIDLNIPGVFAGTFYNAATKADQLPIACTLKKNHKILFKRQDKHWWLTGFKLGLFSEPSELSLDIEITLKDQEMLKAFLKGLKEAGYSDDELLIIGNTVSLVFDEPHTPQPMTRSKDSDWLIQRKNKLMCEKYQEITKDHANMPDKMRAVQEQSPDMFEGIMKLGKSKQVFAMHKTIKNNIDEEAMKIKMRVFRRISQVYQTADQIPFDDNSKIVLMSDCHRGDGSFADDFTKNKNIYLVALTHYYHGNYTYIELGDGDELWENKKLEKIIHVHKDVFWILSKFFNEGRLHFLYGNHDVAKRNKTYVENNYYQYFDEREKRMVPLFKNVKIHEGLILEHKVTGNKIFLVHGHQADFLNDKMWKLARFLVRYFWRPLELFGVNNPTSTSNNYEKKAAVGEKLSEWVKGENMMLVAGHTHRTVFPEVGEPRYFNDGSCVHPRCITAIEIVEGFILLVKWEIKAKSDGSLYVGREVLAGPVKLRDYFDEELGSATQQKK